MIRSIGSKRHAVIGSKWPNDLTENTTEITTENKTSSRPDASQPDTQTAEQEFLTRHPDAVVFSPKKRQWGTQDDLTCAQWLWKKIIALYEQAAECDGEVVRPKEPNWTAWANEIRLMCVQDGRTHKQICEMYSRVSRDPFWCRNVLSPSKLREKWDELSLRLSPSVSTHTENVKTRTSKPVTTTWTTARSRQDSGGDHESVK
ncbi:phage O protein family [Escherichia coli]|uniref:Phage O protein family n=1 Tax=Escherichia coli TaxID=562 RepID=A0A376U167_ECOLX|nr:phage O protein family [Escherichia coli]